MENATNSFPNADALVTANVAYGATFDDADLASPPSRSLVIVACMDARLDLHAMLGLNNGEAHILRNAGGIISDDTIRSLNLSQRFLGTREIVLVHHTKCGLRGLDEQQFKNDLLAEVGERPTWPLDSFDDPYDDVRESVKRLEDSPFIPHTGHVSGFVYNVDSGLLDPVT